MTHFQVTYLPARTRPDARQACDPAAVLALGGGSDADWTALQDEYREVYPRVADALAAWLGNFHGAGRGARAWELAFYRFLCPYVWEYLVRRSYLQALHASTPDAVILGLGARHHLPLLNDTDFRVKSRRDDRYNLEWLSRIATLEGMAVEYLEPADFGLPQAGAAAAAPTARGGLRRRLATALRQLRSVLALLPGKPAVVILGGHFSPQARAHFLADGRYRVLAPALADAPLRDGLAPALARAQLAQLLPRETQAGRILAALAQDLPQCYVEQLPATPRWPRPALILAGFMPTLAERLWAGRCAQQGSRLYIVQHGGGYQEAHLFIFELAERRVADQFLGWGEDVAAGKVPAQRLARFRSGNGEEGGSGVLLAMSEKSHFGYRIASCGREVLAQQERFFAALSPAACGRVIARARPRRYGSLTEQTAWLKNYGGVRVDDGSKPIAAAMAEAGLVLLDRWYSTTFQECVAADKPVIMFKGEGDGMPSPAAATIYAELAACGICHETPEAAAAEVEKVLATGVRQWWSEASRRAAVARYRERFAFLGEAPDQAWSELLHALAQGAPR